MIGDFFFLSDSDNPPSVHYIPYLTSNISMSDSLSHRLHFSLSGKRCEWFAVTWWFGWHVVQASLLEACRSQSVIRKTRHYFLLRSKSSCSLVCQCAATGCSADVSQISTFVVEVWRRKKFVLRLWNSSLTVLFSNSYIRFGESLCFTTEQDL